MPVYQGSVISRWAAGDEVVNVFTFECSSTSVADVGFSIAAYCDVIWGAIADVLSTDLHTERIDVAVRSGGHWNPFGNVSFVVDGTDDADALPQQTAALLIGFTGVRKTLGKKYLGGFTEAHQVQGVLDSTARTALSNALAGYIAPHTAGGVTVVPGVYRLSTETFNPFIGGRIDFIVGTQRRRRQGVGS